MPFQLGEVVNYSLNLILLYFVTVIQQFNRFHNRMLNVMVYFLDYLSGLSQIY